MKIRFTSNATKRMDKIKSIILLVILLAIIGFGNQVIDRLDTTISIQEYYYNE